MTLRKIVNALKGEQPEHKGTGRIVRRMHLHTERYIIDFDDHFREDGWLQFDTDQDAPYFGVWLNQKQLLSLCYAEGDWVLVQCSDGVAFNKEVSDSISFYDEGFIYKAYNEDGTVKTAVQDREKFYIKDDRAVKGGSI